MPKVVLGSWEESCNPPDISHYHIKESGWTYYAVCPGGEEAVLKTVGLKGLAGSNPVHGAIYGVIGEAINTPDCGSGIRRFNSYMAPQ